VGDVAKYGLVDVLKGFPHGALEKRSLRFVQPAADGRAEVDSVGSGRAEPSLIAAT
jgi:hypothetical protein